MTYPKNKSNVFFKKISFFFDKVNFKKVRLIDILYL